MASSVPLVPRTLHSGVVGRAAAQGGAVTTVIRYVSPGEAASIQDALATDGKAVIDNVTRSGAPKNVFVTPDAPLTSVSEIETAYQIGSENPLGPGPSPTHVVTGNAEGITFDYAGTVEGGTGIEMTTKQQIPVISIKPIGGQ